MDAIIDKGCGLYARTVVSGMMGKVIKKEIQTILFSDIISLLRLTLRDQC